MIRFDALHDLRRILSSYPNELSFERGDWNWDLNINRIRPLVATMTTRPAVSSAESQREETVHRSGTIPNLLAKLMPRWPLIT